MLILVAIIMFLALSGVIMVLYYRLTKARESLFAARRDAAHAQTKQAAARKAALKADDRCRQLVSHVEAALANTQEALAIGGHIEVVSQQLHNLITYVTQPALATAPARHAIPPGRYAHPYPQLAPGGYSPPAAWTDDSAA